MTPDCAPHIPKGTGNRIQGTGEPGADAVFLPRLRSPDTTRFVETVIEGFVDRCDHSVEGINPSNDGKVIRLLVPELTGERRKELCKQVKKQIEEGKVAIRSIRRDAMEQIKKMKKDSVITEDDQKIAEKDLQKVTDSHIEELDKIGADKEKEIMSV